MREDVGDNQRVVVEKFAIERCCERGQFHAEHVGGHAGELDGGVLAQHVKNVPGRKIDIKDPSRGAPEGRWSSSRTPRPAQFVGRRDRAPARRRSPSPCVRPAPHSAPAATSSRSPLKPDTPCPRRAQIIRIWSSCSQHSPGYRPELPGPTLRRRQRAKYGRLHHGPRRSPPFSSAAGARRA